MTEEQLRAAIDEANRFLTRARRLYGEHQKAKSEKKQSGSEFLYSPITGSRLAGDVKRASMDLSRALSDLRRTPR